MFLRIREHLIRKKEYGIAYDYVGYAVFLCFVRGEDNTAHLVATRMVKS